MHDHSDSDPDRTGGASWAIVQDEVVDYSGSAESVLPVSEASTVQLRPGPAATNLAIFASERVHLLGLHHHAATVGVVIVKPDFFSFMWWDGTEDCRINGQLARSTVLYSQGEQDGFYATGGARRTMGIAVRRNDLIETLAALRGVDPEDIHLKRTALELSPEAAARYRIGIDAHLKSAIESTSRGSQGGREADQSEGIFGLLIDAYLYSQPGRKREGSVWQPEQIVRKAEERYYASQGASISLADLCAATRVSQSTLYRAFHAVCDEPPLAYLHKRRLADARKALIRSPMYHGAVKHAALSVGLTELGRFSVEYRHLFGESPSVTLSRNLL